MVGAADGAGKRPGARWLGWLAAKLGTCGMRLHSDCIAPERERLRASGVRRGEGTQRRDGENLLPLIFTDPKWKKGGLVDRE